MSKTDVVLLEGARTALAELCGSFREVSASDLGAYASIEAIKRSNISAEEIDHVVFGNVQQSSKDAHFLARHVGLKSGVPVHIPAVTVNRLCGTGIEVIVASGSIHSNWRSECCTRRRSRKYEPSTPCYSRDALGK